MGKIARQITKTEKAKTPLKRRTLDLSKKLQIFNALNCRSRDKSVFQIGLFSNRYLIAAIAVSITLQMLATTLPFFQMALGTVAHSLYDWATIFAISSTVLLADELRKRVKKKRIKKY